MAEHKKMNKKQKNQLILLVILTVALVIVMYWQYLIVPINNECEELKTEIEALEDEHLDMMMEIASVYSYKEEIAAHEAAIAKHTEKLFPLMNNEDADIMLLGYIKECGLHASTLSVSNTLGGEVTSGVYSITASYEAEGSYAQLRKLIEKINAEPAIVILGVSAIADGDTEDVVTMTENGPVTDSNLIPASEDEFSITIELQVFMYEAPVVPEHFDVVSEGETFEAGDAEVLDSAADYL